MFFAIQVPPRWLLSPAARRLYIVCALLSSVLWIEVFWRASTGARAMLEGWTLIRTFPMVLGSAILTVAMWYFWVKIHPPNAFGKGLWLLVLWAGPFGALPYFFCVYLQHPVVGKLRAKQAVAATP